MKLKKIVSAVVAVCMAAALTACGGVSIEKIGLPEKMDMVAGETVKLDVTFEAGEAKEEDILKSAEGLKLTWVSSDETVATVDEDGTVTAVAAGETDISVSSEDGKLSASCTITVAPAVEGVEAPETLELEIGGEKESAELGAKLVPEGATGATLSYESSDEAVATVDENGVVTAVGNGECTITVTATATKPVEQAEENTADDSQSMSESVSESNVTSEATSEVTSEAEKDSSDVAAEEDAVEVTDVELQTWTAETKVTVTTAATGITLSSESGKVTVGYSASVSVYTSPEEAASAVANE